MNKKIIAAIIGVVVVGGAFYSGVVYDAHKSTTPTRNGATFTGMRMGARSGGFTAGDIIAKDATSITIKMQDGSTKIVLVATSTQIMKSAAGGLNDLVEGAGVTVMGATNSDGSVSAQSIQIRPTNSTVRN